MDTRDAWTLHAITFSMKLFSVLAFCVFTAAANGQGYTRILGELPSDVRFELTHQQMDSMSGWQLNNQLVFHKLPNDWSNVLIESFKVKFNSNQLQFPNFDFDAESSELLKKYYISRFGIDITDNCGTLIAPRAGQEFEIAWDVIDSLEDISSLFPIHKPFSSRAKNEQIQDSSVHVSFTCTFRIIVPEPGPITIGPIELTINDRDYQLEKLELEISPRLPETNEGLWMRTFSLFEDNYLIVEQKAKASKKTLREFKRENRYHANMGIPYLELNLDEFDTTEISITRRSHGMGANLDKTRNRLGYFDELEELSRNHNLRLQNEGKERDNIGFKYTIYEFEKFTDREIILEPRHFLNLPKNFELNIKL